jgi:quercetin dioxygenase-like cupin family protein
MRWWKEAMHPELRLIEDFMTDKGTLTLPAQPRMIYVVRGSVTIGRRTLRSGEVLHSEETMTALADDTGATIWRWELSDPRQPVTKPTSVSVISRERLTQTLTGLPDGELLWRGDSVAFPPGGCAYLHRHQGPGIRCVIEGELRVDTNGESHTYQVGDAWFEAGPDPVFAQAGTKPTRFIRVMILPRRLIGKSSIQYVDPEDKDKPKVQQYRVFVDAPLTWT